MTDPDPITPLRADELERLWSTIRRRLENNGVRITGSPLKLTDLGPREVDALCGLLGRKRPSGTAVTVDLRVLDRVLRESAIGVGLVDTLERLDGQVRDRKNERVAAGMERAAMWIAGRSHPVSDDPSVSAWLDSLQRRGRLTRLVGATEGVLDPGQVLTEALDGLHWLLGNAEVLVSSPLPLSTIAAVQLGDAHALDVDTPVGALLRDALKVITSHDDERAAFAAVGVQLDQVVTTALALGLPGHDGSIAAAAQGAGQPLRITWRMLERGVGLDLDAVRNRRIPVWICENPGIVTMAADRFGSRCAPLICTEGMPASVTAALLEALAAVGADLRAHTDFDLGGVAIMHYLVGRFDAGPWKMTTSSYLRALDGPTTALNHHIGDTRWDPSLADTMNEKRRAVHEESIADLLLADLGKDALAT